MLVLVCHMVHQLVEKYWMYWYYKEKMYIGNSQVEPSLWAQGDGTIQQNSRTFLVDYQWVYLICYVNFLTEHESQKYYFGIRSQLKVVKMHFYNIRNSRVETKKQAWESVYVPYNQRYHLAFPWTSYWEVLRSLLVLHCC